MEHDMGIIDRKSKTKQPLVIALFKDHSSLEKTITDLKDNGFWSENIAVLMSKRDELEDEQFKEKIRDVATSGLVSGIATGGILGWLASLDTFFLPSVGLLVAAGPIASALTGIAIGGTIGSLGAAFVQLGLSKFHSRKLEHFVKNKGVIVSVHVEGLKEQLIAKNIFVNNGAIKIYNPMKDIYSQPERREALSNKTNDVQAHPI